MKQYLSYGGGLNSTACIVLKAQGLLDYDEAIYVDHRCDWPETREYVEMIAEKYPITILKPNVGGYDNLYDYADHYKIIPSQIKGFRWCTHKFKVGVINQYIQKPCFMMIGFSTDEAHRAKLQYEDGIENRFPLIENDIDRRECKEIIKKYGLPIPIKSGCFFCPGQRIEQWKKLRRQHPDLYCKAKHLEDQSIERALRKGVNPLYLNKAPLNKVVREAEDVLFEDMKPPCYCEL